MIIEKVCPHFIYQDDVNGEMVISCCTAMKEPHQVHEGNDEMYPCPLGFEAKQCYKVLSLGSDKVHQPTNADRIRSMSDEELAKIIVSESVSEKIPFCQNKPECSKMLDDDELIPESHCIKCALDWLQKPAKETT